MKDKQEFGLDSSYYLLKRNVIISFRWSYNYHIWSQLWDWENIISKLSSVCCNFYVKYNIVQPYNNTTTTTLHSRSVLKNVLHQCRGSLTNKHSRGDIHLWGSKKEDNHGVNVLHLWCWLQSLQQGGRWFKFKLTIPGQASVWTENKALWEHKRGRGLRHLLCFLPGDTKKTKWWELISGVK